jgi:hypothetical protein
MVNFPDIEKIQKDVNKLLERFSTTHEEFTEEKKTSKPEYTKQLRKIYNKINNEVDKLRLYNNEVEKNNREERNKKKGVENKPKQKVGRKKVLKGGDINEINLTSNQNNLTQNETDNTSNQDEFKPLPTPEIFNKNKNNNDEFSEAEKIKAKIQLEKEINEYKQLLDVEKDKEKILKLKKKLSTLENFKKRNYSN